MPDKPKLKLTQVKPAVAMAAGVGVKPLSTDWQSRERGTTKERGYGGDWKRRRLRILRRDNYICQCQRCKADGVVRPAHEVDHIVNQAQGGGRGDDNLQAINSECHRIKTEREAAQGQGR